MLRRSILFFLFISAHVAAQQAPVAAKLVTIREQGSTRYSEAEILATVPLHVGQTVTPNDFKAAADKVLQTGAFQSVGYEFGPAGTGYKFTLKVADEPHWIKTAYANFLWFTRDELDKTIRERVPLYRGEVPLEGGMVEGATAALQELLTKRSIPGTVRFLHLATLSGPVTGGKFVIDGIDMKITHVEVTGGGPEQKKLEDAAARLLNENYEQDEANAVAQLNVLPVAARDGYIRAKIGALDAKLTNPDVQHPAVSVVVPVALGDLYTLSDIVVTGNQVLPAEEIRKQIKVKNGAPANDVEIHDDLDDVKKLYGARGYVMAQATADPEPNDAAHTVVYRVTVKEGDQYRMGKLEISGVNAEGTAKLENMWRLKPGDPYSTEYLREYLRSVGPMIPRTATVKTMSNVNQQTKTVDVTLQLGARRMGR